MESEIKEGGGCVSVKAINFAEQAWIHVDKTGL